MQHSKAKEKFRRALSLGKKDSVRVQHAKAQEEFREAMTPKEKTGSKIAACSGKDSKVNNSNSKRKSTKEIAAFEGSGEVYLEIIICKFPICYTHIANKSSRGKKKEGRF